MCLLYFIYQSQVRRYQFNIQYKHSAKKMDKFQLGSMATLKDAKDHADSAIVYMNQGGQFNRNNAMQFLNAIQQQLTSNETSPISKTMTIHMLKQLTYSGQTRFFSMFSSHKVIQFLQSQAKSIDPKKNMNQKGLKRFPGSPDIGKQYIRVLLELTNFWGEKFGKDKNGQPTKFKKNLAELKNSSVTLPTNYQYFDPQQYKLRSKKGRDTTAVASDASNPMSQLVSKLGLGSQNPNLSSGPTPGQSKSGGKLSNELKYTKSKIGIFLSDLQQAQDADKLQAVLQSNRTFLDKEFIKYQSRESDLQNQEDAIGDYSGVTHFLDQQKKIYGQYIPKNDYQSYITKIKLLCQQTFQMKPEHLGSSLKKNSSLQVPSSGPSQILQQPANSNSSLGRQGSMNTAPRGQIKAAVSEFYKKMQERSKSPHNGFKAVQNELERQKQIAKKNPVRVTSRSPRNLSRSNAGNLSRSDVSNLRESKVHPIFASPPNHRVDFKNYQGDVIMQNRDLTRAVFNVKKDQGVRRFKTSNFRQKNPLYENSQIQVGYKSQAVYQNINGFNYFILLNIFIGNKTEDGIKQFQVEYKADGNQLLYANPKNVDSIIPAGYQNKHDLMITPLSVPYSLMTMNISYKFKDTGHMTSIVLPNSVLKFASYMKTTKSQFDSAWRNSHKLKTNPFRLCRHLAPDSFNKYIPALQNITKYTQFSKQGSQTDLQMFCTVIMLQKHDALLKINVRPNLDVVLQLGVLDNTQEGMEYFKFYLESLELMMKEIDV